MKHQAVLLSEEIRLREPTEHEAEVVLGVAHALTPGLLRLESQLEDMPLLTLARLTAAGGYVNMPVTPGFRSAATALVELADYLARPIVSVDYALALCRIGILRADEERRGLTVEGLLLTSVLHLLLNIRAAQGAVETARCRSGSDWRADGGAS